jgi:hypothetical protein
MSSRPATLRSEEGGREPRWRKAPEGREYLISSGALAFPGVRGDCWGNAGHDYKRGGIPFQPRKGAQKEWLCAPIPLPKCPHTRKGKISNSDDEITAGLGRERYRGWWR